MDIEGFVLFISDLRKIDSPEEESVRVQQELAKIRQRFNAPQVSGYEMRKNIWKLIYCHMLGYDIDFGHMEIINLLASNKYHEKLAGYMGFNILLVNHDELVRLSVNSIQEDINSGNEMFISLALSFIACTPSLELSERLYYHVIKIIDPSYNYSIYLKKKAFLALTQILNTSPSLLKVSEWIPVIENALKVETNEAFLITVGAFMENMFKKESNWEGAIQLILEILLRITKEDVPQIYMYHTVPAPWLSIKYLHLLTLIKPQKKASYIRNIGVVLITILTKPVTKPHSKIRRGVKLSKKEITAENVHNTVAMLEHAIKLEALKAAIAWVDYVEGLEHEMITQIINIFTTSKSTTIRYMGLDMIASLSKIASKVYNLKDNIHLATKYLQSDDQDVRKQSGEILYNICDKSNWKNIIPELLATLRYSGTSLQSDLVVKIASIAEKFASDTSWHIDTIFNLIVYASDIMEDSIWHRIIWWLSGLKNDHDSHLQKYAVNRALDILNEHKVGFSYSVPEPLQKLCGYLLGEFGDKLPQSDRVTAFNLINGYFMVVSHGVKMIFLITLAKFAVDERFKSTTLSLLRNVSENDMDFEVQTRACEMLRLLSSDKKFYEDVLKSMPNYPTSLKKLSVQLPCEKDQSVVEHKHVTKTLSDMLKEKIESKTREAIEMSKPNEQLNEATNDERWKLFLTSEVNNGILYTEKYFSISLRHLYKGHVGKFQLIVQSIDYALNISSITFKDVAGLLFSQSKFESITLKSGEKTSIKVSFQAMQPFIETPTCNIIGTIITNSKKTKEINVVFDLPLLINKFMSPLQVKASQFANFWNSFQGDCIVNTKVKVKYETLDSLIESISRYIDMHISKTSDTIYASSTMIIGMPDENRKPTNLQCFIMIQLGKSSITLEVRSPNPLASKSIANTIKLLI